jgi:hypothetical protein
VRHVLTAFCKGQMIFAAHVTGLLAPGHKLPVHEADQTSPADITAWSPEELALMIEEGRRQFDRQVSDLSDIRSRAQWVFAVAVAALAALGAGLVSSHPATGLVVLWIVGLLGLVWGVGGAAAILVARADLKTIHTAILSQQNRPVQLALAEAYARMMPSGENTVAARLTVLRQAVVWCLCGGYLGLTAALLAS